MPTTPGGRFSPGDSDDWDLTTDLAAMQVSNENATATEIAAAIAASPPPTLNYRVGTNAQRLALASGSLFEGLRWRTTDLGGQDWLYTGGAWYQVGTTSTIIRPTSVVGGTIQNDGSVNFSAVAAVSLNGVFTNRFREFEVRYRTTTKTTSSGIGIRLRSGSTDNTGASSYFWRRNGSTGSGFAELQSTGASFEPDFQGVAVINKSLHLFQPNVAAFTPVWSSGGLESNNAGLLTNMISFAGQHQVASAFDGITLFVSAQNMTGSVVVIGHP